MNNFFSSLVFFISLINAQTAEKNIENFITGLNNHQLEIEVISEDSKNYIAILSIYNDDLYFDTTSFDSLITVIQGNQISTFDFSKNKVIKENFEISLLDFFQTKNLSKLQLISSVTNGSQVNYKFIYQDQNINVVFDKESQLISYLEVFQDEINIFKSNILRKAGFDLDSLYWTQDTKWEIIDWTE